MDAYSTNDLKHSMTRIIKRTIFKIIAIVISIAGLNVSTGFAEQKLPDAQNCANVSYMSGAWNKGTSIDRDNKALGYKKLICMSGREAYILVKQKDGKYTYSLVNDRSVKLSPSTGKICKAVRHYCQ